ncbi:hypothetical protein [Endozoicomonas sp. ALB032]|uniref:hypothetical protein n=1 Tax=Endozoicomonas sp. ALB032 TaxID=3403082 RepID=UPI003BB5679E
MKIDIRLIILLCLCLLSSYSNSNDLHFTWKLERLGQLVLDGTATSSANFSHNGRTINSYLNNPTSFFSYISGDRFVNYDLTSSANIELNQHNTANRVPAFFSSLLGNGQHNLQHRLHTRYTLRSETKTTARKFAHILSFFAMPFIWTSRMLFQNLLNSEEKVNALEAATPTTLPEHVSIDSRSISVSRSPTDETDNAQTLLSSSTKAIDDNNLIFDLFLNNPETRQWIIEHLLNSTSYGTFNLIIPELFNTVRPANIIVHEKTSEDDSANLQPSNFLSLYFQKGTVVQYHLRKLPNNNIQILAISVNSNFYTLTFSIDNYDAAARANQPPAHFAEFPENCNCGGACNCATSRNNDTQFSFEAMRATMLCWQILNDKDGRFSKKLFRGFSQDLQDREARDDFNMALYHSFSSMRNDIRSLTQDDVKEILKWPKRKDKDDEPNTEL